MKRQMVLHFQRCDIQEVHGVLKDGEQSRATEVKDETAMEKNIIHLRYDGRGGR